MTTKAIFANFHSLLMDFCWIRVDFLTWVPKHSNSLKVEEDKEDSDSLEVHFSWMTELLLWRIHVAGGFSCLSSHWNIPQHQPVAGNTELIRFFRANEEAPSNSEVEVLKWWHKAGSVDSRTLWRKHWLRVWIWPPDTAHQGWIYRKDGMSLCNCMCKR